MSAPIPFIPTRDQQLNHTLLALIRRVTELGSAVIGPAGGDLSGQYPDPDVTAIHSGSTKLGIGTVNVLQLLQRVGAEIIGIERAGIDSTAIHPGGAAGGDLTGTYPDPALTATGVTAGTYGTALKVARITVDAKGRLTFVDEVVISGGGGGGGDSFTSGLLTMGG